MCCDDAYLVTPRVSALAGCDRFVLEPLVIKKHFVFLLFSEFYFKPTSYSISEDSEEEPIEEEWYRISGNTP
ncbi:hypothetical protein Tco_0493275 [Tanacetum coccineum]